MLSIFLAAALLRNHVAPKAVQVDLEAPTHYFIPRVNEGINVLSCDFTRDLDRDNSHNLWSLPLQPCSLVSGWGNPGAKGVMASRNRSMLSFFTDSSDWTHLVLRVKTEPHPADDRVQTMSIRINKHEIGQVEVPTEWTTISVEIPSGVVRKGVNNVSLKFAHRVPHGAAKRRKSMRPLFALNLREVALTRSSNRRGARLTALRRLLGRYFRSDSYGATQVYDRELQRYVLSTAGTLVMPLFLPDDADLLEIEVLSSTADGSQGGQIILNLQGMASGRVISKQLVDFEEHGSGSFRGEIPVAALAGETSILWLDIKGETDEVTLEITAPRIVERHTTVKDRRKKQSRAQVDHEPPDIVLITLDAARPHHFSCYGYDRPTTPNIDRLAAESLIFTNAFALVPNTRRSVPTMITGLSFLNHQVVGSDSTLSEAATTIAEHLVDAGYRTACFSASPNNSRVNRNHQGYEEFFELWNEVPRTQSRDPHYVSTRVVDWLTSVDDSRPLHLQLHFVPPHAPYAPAPEFDLFSDPHYDGECDGSPDTILGIDKGGKSFNAADMKQLIALYDGNLRAADDAVEEVLSALRQRPRWQDTVVLVTADHGEAFYEHRRMGHNNTVYDEMLRVPFILRVPGETNREKFDLDRLVTLADIAPTLLATVPRQLNAHFDGIDLLDTTGPRHGTDNRFFVARTGHDTPIWGFRTRRFKLILANSGQGELYDLVNDPGEQRNLRFSSPEVFVGLGLILTRNLIVPPSLTGGARISEVPESDRKMLEALGYIE